MKTILKISVLLNVTLLGEILLLWRHPRLVEIPEPATLAMAADVEPQTPPAPVVRIVAAPFRWSQLLSNSNYLAFVASLRTAGCPESTVADIVQGDVGRAYAMMRERLNVSAMEPGRWSGQEQEQMAAYFLGQIPNAEVAAGIAEEPAAVGQNNNQATDDAQIGNATLAAFLQSVDLTTPGMGADQQQEIAGLRQGLLAQISTASQAPNNQANTSSTSGSDNPAPAQTSEDNSRTGIDNLQAATDNSQPAQAGTGDSQRQPSQAIQALIQASEQESILGGLFGMGAAMQYEQSQDASQ